MFLDVLLYVTRAIQISTVVYAPVLTSHGDRVEAIYLQFVSEKSSMEHQLSGKLTDRNVMYTSTLDPRLLRATRTVAAAETLSFHQNTPDTSIIQAPKLYSTYRNRPPLKRDMNVRQYFR